mgnify:FL=1
MSSKVKIITKVQSFEDVQKSLQDIEKNFNKLTEAVNKKSENEKKETEGESGDIKTINEGTNRGNDYSFEVKTDKGWQSPILKPHYESEWVKLGINSNHKFMHTFNSKMVMFQLFFKTDGTGVKVSGEDANWGTANDIFGLSHMISSNPYIYTSALSHEDGGLSLYLDNNYISVGTGNQYIFFHDNTHSSTGGTLMREISGYFKVLAWKTGVAR